MKTSKLIRKTPPAIEAVRWDGTTEHSHQIVGWIRDWNKSGGSPQSLERDGPWVVRFEASGTVRCYTDEQFQETFEIVGE